MPTLITSVTHVLAQTSAPVSSDIPIFQHFVLAGGWVTWCILIPLSLVAVSLVVHFALTVRRRTLLPPSLVDELQGTLALGPVGKAAEIARRNGGMLASVVLAGLARLSQGADAVRAALDEALDQQTAKQMRRIELLNIIGNVSPMIGLFGTVVGMIRAFNRMAAMEGGLANAANAAKLSGDISIAFVNTFWGLLIAIPALAIFALFRNRVDAISDACNNEAERLLNLLGRQPKQSAAPMETPAPA
jgi:biopolymer transport protein ExbB